MKKHENFFDNIYEDVRITDDRTIDYTGDHIANLEENNDNHQFDDTITDTKAKYLALKTKSAAKSDAKGNRKASTVTVDEYEEKYIELVRNTVGNVTSLYLKGSYVYTDFFPKPIKYYTSPLRPKIGEHLDHFISKFGAHNELGDIVLNKLIAHKALWDPARDAQEHKKGEVKALIINTKIERKALNLQLLSNLLTIAKIYLGNPSYINVFFTPSKLYPHTRHPEDETIEEEFSVVLTGHETKNTGLVNIVGKKARFVVIKGRVQVYTVASLENMDPGSEAITIEEDGDITKALVQLGDDEAPYLILRNLGDDEAEVIIEWID